MQELLFYIANFKGVTVILIHWTNSRAMTFSHAAASASTSLQTSLPTRAMTFSHAAASASTSLQTSLPTRTS